MKHEQYPYNLKWVDIGGDVVWIETTEDIQEQEEEKETQEYIENETDKEDLSIHND